MKKLFNGYKVTNRVSLIERSMAAIHLYDPPYIEGDDPDDVLELLEIIYELEYKYNALRNFPFTGLDARYDNIMKIIEKKAKEVIPILAETFEDVFSTWLGNHAITNPEEWAHARFYEGGYDSQLEINGFDDTLGAVISEAGRYTGIEDQEDLLKEIMSITPELLEGYFNTFISEWGQMLLEELQADGLEEFNDVYTGLHYGLFADKEFETEEEAEDYLDIHFSAFDKDFFEVFGSRHDAINEVISRMGDYATSLEDMQYDIDLDVFFLTIYEKIVFPAWFDYWEKQGIVETRNTVEKVYADIQKIESMPLQKQFLTLNIAINTNHQTGSMMEYYEATYEVGKRDFDRLSELNVDNWNEELQEIGVVLQ